MKIAITGPQNSGKTTVFNALTGLNQETTPFASVMEEPNIGIVKVPDERVDKLSGIFKPKKINHAVIEYVDFMGLTKGDLEHNRKVFDLIRDADAVATVVRAFEDDSVAHPEESVNPARDAANMAMELLFFDLDLVEKRLTRMEQARKRGKKQSEEEESVLQKCRESLEAEVPLRQVAFTDEESASLKHLQFLTIKPVMILVNLGEGRIGDQGAERAVAAKLNLDDGSVISLSAKIEAEIAQLSPDEADEFMKDLGIAEPALNRLVKASYRRLGLISFLTVGEDEVRAWTINDGTIALNAAGKVHSDIERGFIRAELVAYDDFMSAGGMAQARKAGTLRLEGKTYVVKDGDIINFRFNV